MGATNSFSNVLWLVYSFLYRFPGSFRKETFSSHAPVEKPLNKPYRQIDQKSPPPPLQILKLFARTKISVYNSLHLILRNKLFTKN
jgi:hypothetical protein